MQTWSAPRLADKVVRRKGDRSTQYLAMQCPGLRLLCLTARAEFWLLLLEGCTLPHTEGRQQLKCTL